MGAIRTLCRQLLHRTALRFGFRLSRVKPFERAIRRFGLRHDDFYFVQVGAYNGVTSDPFVPWLIEGVWTCVLIEPQRRYFDVLQNIYGDRENIQCHNVAIGTEDGTTQMYVVREDAEGLPHWASQLASFRYEVVASHADRIPNIKELIETQNVPCRTLGSLVQESQLPRIDLVAIDVEGYDFEVLKQIDQLPARPKFVYYEHGHLSDADYRESLKFLAERGYRTHSVNEGDTFGELAD